LHCLLPCKSLRNDESHVLHKLKTQNHKHRACQPKTPYDRKTSMKLSSKFLLYSFKLNNRNSTKKCRFSFQDGDITSYNHSYAYVLELVRIYGPWNVHKVSCDCVEHQVQVQSVSQLPWHCDVLLTDKTRSACVKTFPQSCDICFV